MPVNRVGNSHRLLAAVLCLCAVMAGCQMIPQWPDSEPVGARETQETRERSRPESSQRPAYANIESPALVWDHLAQLAGEHGERVLPAASVGYYLDVQFASLKALEATGVAVNRRPSHILVGIPGAVGADSDVPALSPAIQLTLDRLALTLAEYDRSVVAIGGYTDDRSAEPPESQPSLRRAVAVANYLAARGVESWRIAVQNGRGSAHRAGREDGSGKADIRRVELALWPLVEVPVPTAGPVVQSLVMPGGGTSG